MTKRLYYHQTDGGAEYLCTSPVDGTDEGDLHTAFIRLDGEPELLNPSASVAPELLDALKCLVNICTHPQATKADMKRIAEESCAAIRKAEGER